MVAVLRSWVRSFLLLALLPVIILASTDAATATTYSTETKAVFHFDSVAPGVYGDCGISAYYASGTTLQIKAAASCAFGWSVQEDAWYFDRQLSLTFSGPSCSSAQPVVFGDMNEGTTYTGTTTMSTMTCAVDTACWDMFIERDFTADYHAEGCVSLPMGAPPEGSTLEGCPDGQPTAVPTVSMIDTDSWGGPWYGYEQFTVSAPLNLVAQSEVQVVAFYRFGGTLRTHVFPTKLLGPGAATYTAEAMGEIVPEPNAPFAEQGVQVVIKTPSQQPGWYNGNESLRWNFNPLTEGPPDTDMGAANWPERCSWYWGHKHAATANDNHDEPMGPLGGTLPQPGPEPTATPPDPSTGPSGCTFSWSDPTSWASAGMCAAVQLLGAILGLIGDLLAAVGGLAADIIAGIGDLLSGLFVPSDGFMEGKADQIKAAWESTPPMVFLDGVTDVGNAFVIDGPSGCTGPALTFNSPVGHDSVTVHPMSACDAGMANLASLVKIALTVMVYVGGFLAAVRIVGAAFGVDASIGRGDD